ncbi:MAG TPA: hypothetical protein EYP86_00325 [Candidatus Altiarchaeales archaeon]|nr:hypothetical protein [Candidatus Altiarchaeales archaeon]
MPEYRKFTKDTVMVGITSILLRIKSIIFIALIAKTLGASIYGIYVTLMVTVNLLAPLSALGLTSAIIRFLAGEKDRKRIQEGYSTCLFTVFICSSFLSILVFASAPHLASTIFGNQEAVPIIQAGAFLILVQTIDKISFSFFRAFRKMFHFSILQIMVNIGEIMVCAILVLNGFDLSAIVLSFLGIKFIIFLIAFSMIFKEVGISRPKISLIKPYLKFSLPLIPHSISGKMIDTFDRYLIGYFLSSFYVGVYSVAYGIAMITNLFMGILSVVLFPTVSKLWEEKKIHELKNHFKFTLKYFLMLGIPSIFGLTVLSKEILTIMTGQESVSQSSFIVPVIATSGVFFYSIFPIFGLIFLLVKKTHYNAIILGSGVILNILLNLILIPFFQSHYNYGIMGAAIATFLTFLSIGIITVKLTRNYFKFDIDKLFILKSIIASSLMAILVYKIRVNTFPEIFIPVFIGAISYFALLFLLHAFSEKEIKFFKEIIIAIKGKLAGWQKI